jgi:hypothetical protein
MAAANKSQPLTIEDLIDAQRSITKSSTDEGQIAKAQEQIDRLMKLKGDAQHVTLGDVRKELKDLRKDVKEGLKGLESLNMTPAGTAPRADRPPLPRLVSDNTRRGDVIDVDAKEVVDTRGSNDTERTQKLQKIGSVIDQKTDLQLGGSKNNIVSGRNNEVFTKFISETKQRDDILKDANDQQRDIFHRLEETMLKLKEAGSEDSQALRQQLAKLGGELKETGDSSAKNKMTNILGNAQSRAATGNRGNTGTLGDAVSALRGKKTVLKEGFSYDQSGAGSQIRDDKGKFASAKVAGKGRLAGAASILGNFIGEKTEKFVEGQRSEGLQKFADNFRSSDETPAGTSKAPVSGTRLEKIAGLQGQQDALTGTDQPKKGRPQLSVIEGGKSAAAIKGGTDKMEVQTLNVTAKVVNITGGSREGKSAAQPKRVTAAAPTSTATAAPKPISVPAAPVSAPASIIPRMPAAVAAPAAAAPVAATAAPAESGGGMLDTVMDAGGSLMGKGKGLLGKAGGILKGAKGGLIGGGLTALGGMALSAGGDYLKEQGYETAGGAVDTLGTAASWGGTGAMIGSVIPGVGTAIGGAIGGIAGAGYGLYKNFFGGDDKEEAQAAVGAPNPYDSVGAGLPARATGGPVVEGKSYLVGEKGPEVMTPASDGKITPNGPGIQYGMKQSDVKGDAISSYEDQDGNIVKEYEGGIKVRELKAGGKEISGAGGTSTFDASGKETKQVAPSFVGGAREERDLVSGETTKSYDQGGLSVKQTRNASGELTKREASYDMGVAKMETTENADELKAGKVSYKMKNESGEVLSEGQVTREELQSALLQIGSGNQPAPPRPTSQPAPVTNNNTIMPRGDVRARESAVEKYNNTSASFY